MLTKVAINEIKKIQKSGVSEVDLNKVKEAQRRSLESNLKQNNYWIGQLTAAYQLGDPGRITEALKRIDAVSSESLQAAANMINLKKYVRVVLYPEKN
jgi:zinc protease